MSQRNQWRRAAVLLVIAGWLFSGRPVAAAGDPVRTRQLIAVLTSPAALDEKARACEQLGQIGTKEAVPALAALLTDEHLSAYARTGLEGIPDPGAAAALRESLARLKGSFLVGVINSLGARRDPQAVGALRKLTIDPNFDVARGALLALGRIANQESIAILRHALADNPASLRAEAAAACLLAAQQQLAAGHAKTARALYDAVRDGQFPSAYRGAATHGAILARGPEAVPFLVEQLRSDDAVVRNAALLTIREMPGEALANALNQELNRSRPELEIPLLLALADCHNAQSIGLLRDKASVQDPDVRKASLTALGRIGSPAAAEVLLQNLAETRSPEETALVANGLAGIQSPAVDDLVLRTLAAAQDAGLRVRLIHVIDRRGATNAAAELLKQAADPDAKVALAALSALKNVAGSGELPALMVLTRTCSNDARREAAESAVYSACAGDPSRGGETVLAAFEQATDPIEKNSWARVLISLGYRKALPALEAAMRDPSESVAANAIENLGRWPDPSPVASLLGVAEADGPSARRQRALASVIQLVAAASEEHPRADRELMEWLLRVAKAGPADADKHRLISVLGRLAQPESFSLLLPYLEQPEFQADAALAVVQIAPALVTTVDSTALANALERVAATVKNPEIRDRAIKLAATIPGKDHASSLFDGRSLAGWEGDTNVWRVRDGLIVGGSMEGNPRNEFLATTRPYTNFVLRLQYKLVGTEGFVNSGVQFDSVRTKQPPNEMSGFQADIGAGCSGSLYDESRRNKFVARAAAAQILRLEKPGEWNDYEVRAEGARIRIKLNGEQTVDYTESDSSIPLSGAIGLQIHGGNKAEVSFRNIYLQELP